MVSPESAPADARPRHRVTRKRLLAAAALVAAVLTTLGIVRDTPTDGTPSAAAPPAKPKAETLLSLSNSTVVSLTFDESSEDQFQAAQTLKTYGLQGTFFINSGFLGAPGYLTVDNVKSLAADGNEIGGHTVNLADLPTLSADEATRQVCIDRRNLMQWGLEVSTFSYPFGAVNPTVESIVKNCGYNGARGQGELRSKAGCPDCALSESIHPADPYRLKAPAVVDKTWTLADLQKVVASVPAGGGWVQLAFHHVCDNVCDPASVDTGVFREFAAWLAAESAQRKLAVRTVGQILGGDVHALVDAPVAAPAGRGVNALKNPDLEAPGPYGLPACWQTGGYGVNKAAFETVPKGRSASRGELVVVSGYESGDAKLLPKMDLGACAPSVTAGRTYSLRAWYTSDAATQFAVYYRTDPGTWKYWTSSNWFPASSGYAEARWTTPEVPAEAKAISFGLSIFRNGTLISDDYSMYDADGAP